MWYASILADESGSFIQFGENRIPHPGKTHLLKVFSSESPEEIEKIAREFLKEYRKNPKKALYKV